jgi:hypothetical protein
MAENKSNGIPDPRIDMLKLSDITRHIEEGNRQINEYYENDINAKNVCDTFYKLDKLGYGFTFDYFDHPINIKPYSEYQYISKYLSPNTLINLMDKYYDYCLLNHIENVVYDDTFIYKIYDATMLNEDDHTDTRFPTQYNKISFEVMYNEYFRIKNNFEKYIKALKEIKNYRGK